MGLSLTTQWTLVASGLMAHADEVMSGEECEHLMTLVDEEVDGDDYAQWLAIVSDPEQLQGLLQELTLPPAETHRQILEGAWLMAVVDGERAQSEHDALERIATRLGVDTKQLDAWRDAWNEAQHGNAGLAAAALAHVLGGGDAVATEQASAVKGWVQDLPTTHEHREQLAETVMQAQELAPLERELSALSPAARRDLLRRLATMSLDEAATERWRKVGHAAGLGDDELDALS